MRVVDRPSRDVALAWLRFRCPDLEIQEGEEGHRARLSIGGATRVIEVRGPDSREQIVQRLWEAVRASLGMPVPGAPRPTGAGDEEEDEESMTRRIVDARAAGQDDAAEQLERKLVARRTGVPMQLSRPLAPRDPRDVPPSARREEGGDVLDRRSRRVY